MDSRTKWITTRIRTGWAFLAAGVIVGAIGMFTELQHAVLPYNPRLLTGLGILLAGIGVAYLVRYRAALQDERAARRLTVEERDERLMLIRMRAGNRAFWVSALLVYAGLMWASFAGNGSLPPMSGDGLWYFLAAAVLVPFGVYAASILVDERRA